MRLPRKIAQVLCLITALSIAVVFAVLIGVFSRNTFAEGDENYDSFSTLGAKFVTFYDNGDKLTVKTDVKTVNEALNRAGIIINQGDIVEPGLDAEINADNYFINIYRARPVVVKDGIVEKYIMSASFDSKTIMNQAGITVYDGDEIEIKPSAGFLETGVANVYEIKRNGGRTITEEIEIPFREETVKDYNIPAGTSEVRQLGEVGLKRASYNVLYIDNVEVSRELISEEVVREPVNRIVAVGATMVEKNPLTASKGVNIYTVNVNGSIIERKETYYDLPMSGVMANASRMCGVSNYYTVRADGAKVDAEGYVLVAAHLGRYPRCSVVETSLGPGKVYDTGGFADSNPEQFDLATDWTNRDGR